MSWLGDKYTFHILVSYGSALILLGGLIWASVAANARARRELEKADKERGR
ncbi:MAG: heme exporter protein CcmD [Pseudomonadota bacterium]